MKKNVWNALMTGYLVGGESGQAVEGGIVGRPSLVGQGVEPPEVADHLRVQAGQPSPRRVLCSLIDPARTHHRTRCER
jgi:hypothetical protein